MMASVCFNYFLRYIDFFPKMWLTIKTVLIWLKGLPRLVSGKAGQKSRFMGINSVNTTKTTFENSKNEEAEMSDNTKVGANKFSNARRVTFTISDLHLGEGGYLDDFKYPPDGVSIHETDRYRVMDNYFTDFIDWIIANLGHCKVRLNLLGDIFDFSAVILPNESIAWPYEEEGAAKMLIIIATHTEFFSALRRFCAQSNCELAFFTGNHDWELNWPTVQEILREHISKYYPERIKFLYDELDNGVYYRHGESEPHVQIDPNRPIIKCIDLAKLPEVLKTGKLNFAMRDILDVPLGYYLNSHLGNKIKKYNYLIGRMHTHGFVWADALKHIGRSNWFRSRWFAPVAAYQTINTLLTFTIFARFWHIKWKAGVRQIMAVLWWTITGALTGYTTRDSALRVLRERNNNTTDNKVVKAVINGHEHKYTLEVLHENNQTKVYLNVGTWSPQFEVKIAQQGANWKRLGWLQKAFRFIKHFFTKSELVLSINLTVGVVVLDERNEQTVNLARFDHLEKTLKQVA